MKSLDQVSFDEVLRSQLKVSSSIDSSNEISHVDLSELHFKQRELGGTVIAMSRLPATNFDSSFNLCGLTWIGNEISNSRFQDVSLNKAEILDCVFTDCTFDRVSFFRADLSGTKFSNCRFSHIDLAQRTTLLRAVFEQCHFANVVFDSEGQLTAVGTVAFDDTGRRIGAVGVLAG